MIDAAAARNCGDLADFEGAPCRQENSGADLLGPADDVPGRPRVEDWLRGVEEDDIPQAQVAWREEVRLVTDDVLSAQPKSLTREQMLQAFPLKPHELLKDSVDRIFKTLVAIAKQEEASKKGGAKAIQVWLVDNKGKVELSNLLSIGNPDAKAGDRFGTLQVGGQRTSTTRANRCRKPCWHRNVSNRFTRRTTY